MYLKLGVGVRFPAQDSSDIASVLTAQFFLTQRVQISVNPHQPFERCFVAPLTFNTFNKSCFMTSYVYAPTWLHRFMPSKGWSTFNSFSWIWMSAITVSAESDIYHLCLSWNGWYHVSLANKWSEWDDVPEAGLQVSFQFGFVLFVFMLQSPETRQANIRAKVQWNRNLIPSLAETMQRKTHVTLKQNSYLRGKHYPTERLLTL